MTAYCLANVALGFTHTGFACYLQRRLVSGLQDQALPGSATGHGQCQTLTEPGGEAGRPQMPSSGELMQRAGHILLYDVGFCLYVFVFIGALVLNCAGLGWASSCQGPPWPSVAGGLMLLFAFLAVSFGALWYCALACDSMCGFLGTKRPAQQRRHHGLARVIFGRTAASVAQAMAMGPAGGVHPTHPPPATGRTVVPHGEPAATPYGAPQAVHAAPQAGRPDGGGGGGGAAAANRARQGLAMAGRGLQAIGRVLGGR